MSINNQNDPHVVSIKLGAIAADQLLKLMALGTRKAVMKSLKVVDPTGVAAHATNYVKIQLKVGATLLMEYSTQTGAEGALAAGVWGEAPESFVEVDGGDIDLNIDIVGTGALNALSVAALEMYYV
jgi:hypothetical protein